MRIAIINGPNLNLLGTREPQIYGNQSFESFFDDLKKLFPHIDLVYFQSNHEGQLVDYIQSEGKMGSRLIINAAAYSHTSLAIPDAIQAVSAQAVEVHISNIFARETFRHHSYLSGVCLGSIVGMGLFGYQMAIQYFIQNTEK